MPPPPRRPHPFLDAAAGKTSKNPSSGTKTPKTSSSARRTVGSGSGGSGSVTSTPVSEPPASVAKASASRRKTPSSAKPAQDVLGNAGECGLSPRAPTPTSARHRMCFARCHDTATSRKHASWLTQARGAAVTAAPEAGADDAFETPPSSGIVRSRRAKSMSVGVRSKRSSDGDSSALPAASRVRAQRSCLPLRHYTIIAFAFRCCVWHARLLW